MSAFEELPVSSLSSVFRSTADICNRIRAAQFEGREKEEGGKKNPLVTGLQA